MVIVARAHQHGAASAFLSLRLKSVGNCTSSPFYSNRVTATGFALEIGKVMVRIQTKILPSVNIK